MASFRKSYQVLWYIKVSTKRHLLQRFSTSGTRRITVTGTTATFESTWKSLAEGLPKLLYKRFRDKWLPLSMRLAMSACWLNLVKGIPMDTDSTTIEETRVVWDSFVVKGPARDVTGRWSLLPTTARSQGLQGGTAFLQSLWRGRPSCEIRTLL